MKALTIPRVAAVAVAFSAVAAAADRTLVEAIVVRVNDRILTVADMRKRAAERAAETGTPVPPEKYPELVAEAADDLCLLERAVELKIEVGEDELGESLKGLREQNKIESDEQFEATLRSMGMSLEQLRSRMREQMLMNRVLSREIGSLPLTDEELRQRYAREQDGFRVPEQVHLEHLIIPIGQEPDGVERATERARRLVAAARSGSSFALLVKLEVDAGTGNGGDLGDVAVPDLRPEIRDAVAKLKPAEIADPFRTSAGIHVVRLVDRTPPSVKPFEQVAGELRQREMAERYRARMDTVVDGLKKRYIVEVHAEQFTPGS